MYIILDDEGYVKFLSATTPMEGAIELPDDEELNLTYITCYRLNPEGTGLMLDAEKLSAQKDALGAQSKIFELKQKLAASDFRILGRIREQALGTELHMSDEEYLMLEAERESYVRQIRELQDGVKLVTNVSDILAEGENARKEKLEQAKAITTIPEVKEEMDKFTESLENGELVTSIVEKVKESFSASTKDVFSKIPSIKEVNEAHLEESLDKFKDLVADETEDETDNK